MYLLIDLKKKQLQTANDVADRGESGADLMEQSVQEEDLGFDPWDEATRSLQDLMKIESDTQPPGLTAPSTGPAPASNSPHANKPHAQPNGSADVNRQFFAQPASQQAMFKANDMQAFYKLQLNGKWRLQVE